MKKTIIIDGMSCHHCVNHVTNALNELEGVTNVTVDLDSKTAHLTSSVDISDEVIIATIDDVGYEVISIN